MGLFLRIFYGGCCKDIALQTDRDFLIGSQTDHGFEIPDSDLLPEHIRLHYENNHWVVSCMGETYLNGRPINASVLKENQVYLFSRKDRISALVVGQYQDAVTEVPLRELAKLTLGRDEQNDVVLHSRIVSEHHAEIIKTPDGYQLVNLSRSNGTYVNGEKIDSCILKEHDKIAICAYQLIFLHDTVVVYGTKHEIRVNAVCDPKNTQQKTEDGIIIVKRSPRLKLEIPPETIEIQQPPQLGEKPEIDKISIFLPLISTIGVAIIMSVVMSPVMLLYTLPMQLISGFMSYRSYRKQIKKYDERTKSVAEKYYQYLDHMAAELAEKGRAQLRALAAADPSASECVQMICSGSDQLWDRSPSDNDFASVRIGHGKVTASAKMVYKKTDFFQEKNELTEKMNQMIDQYSYVDNAPVTCSLARFPVWGIVGGKDEINSFINHIVIQLATHHAYTELKLVVICSEKNAAPLLWMGKLPHLMEEQNHAAMVSTKEEMGQLSDAFRELLQKRDALTQRNDSNRMRKVLPFYILLILDSELTENCEWINALLLEGNMSKKGVSAVFCAGSRSLLPAECEEIIELDHKTGKLYNKNIASVINEFTLDEITQEEIDCAAGRLVRMRCAESEGKNIVKGKKIPAMPHQCSFFDMLGIRSTDELDLEKNWAQARVEKDLSAVLGLGEGGVPLTLNIIEEAMGGIGPHGLIAGKTGSGKSEVLLSYLLGLAVHYSPYELQLLLIDFKGGATANKLEDLPHTNCIITNIDGSDGSIDEGLIKRSLAFLRAEMDTRQKKLSASGSESIGKYYEKYAAGEVKESFPHLMVVVDEFAELKNIYPEYMKELVSISRIGRSLGMHLILATQTPNGIVDDQIWNNAGFKISLAVADEMNSKAILRSTVAAGIKDAGRGYLYAQNGEILKLFQSGYSGVTITNSDGKKVTQIEATVCKIKDYCDRKGYRRLKRVCLPLLPKRIPFEAGEREKSDQLSIGRYDHVSCQSQDEYRLNVFDNHTMVIGSAKMGKTNLLQTVLRQIAEHYSPKEVNLYCIDYASGVLKNFETLCHVGGVVIPGEEEKLGHFFQMMYREMEIRKEKQLKAGVSSFDAYYKSGHRDLPRIVVLIDGLTMLKDHCFQEDDPLLGLCAEGVTYGITLVIANMQTSGIAFKYFKFFHHKIAFYCNEASEYMALFGPCSERITNIPGRFLADSENKICEGQGYLAFDGEEAERIYKIKAFLKEINQRYAGLSAQKIPVVPDEFPYSDAVAQTKKQQENFSLVAGIDYANVKPYSVNFKTVNLLGVSGRANSGKHNFIKYMINALHDIYPQKTEVYIFDSFERKLSSLQDRPNVAGYEIISRKCIEVLGKITDELRNRYENLEKGNMEILDQSKLILLVINSPMLLNEIGNQPDANHLLKQITEQYRSLNVCVLLGNIENKEIPYNANELLKKLKESKHIFLFDDLFKLKLYDLYGMQNPYRKAERITPGDAYFSDDGRVIKLKTPLMP